MKIAILSRNAKLYSTKRLKQAGRERGHSVRVLDPLRCYMRIEPGEFVMHYKGKPLPKFDAVIPRIGASITRYGTAVVRQFEMMRVFTPNRAEPIMRARDKLHGLQLLAQQGLGLPITVFGDNPDDTTDLLSMLGKPPHVIKLVEGSQGQGVVLAEKLASSQSVIEAFRGLYANFLVQEFIRANPMLKPDQIAVTCSKQALDEVRVCMTKDLQFTACGAQARRSMCRQDRIRMPPVRLSR